MASSSKSVKFEISLKELKVTFEGDIQTAERMQGQITGAINSLASAQHRMLTPGTPATPPVELSSGGGKRRGRRRRAGSAAGIDPNILDAAVVAHEGNGDSNGEGPTDPPRRVRRSSSGTQTELITGLKAEGFFASKRSIGDIRSELARKGHTFKSNEISRRSCP